MSVMLRTLLRDPLVTRGLVIRPLSRALRRFDDDFWPESRPTKRITRWDDYESPAVQLMEDMNRHMALAVSKMQEFAEDLDAIDSIVGRFNNNGPKRRNRGEAVLRRTESGGLQLALDVGGFKPEDLKIKLVDDNLVIEAMSESSGEDSYNRNQFKRWFKLPEDCKLDEIRSKLTEDHKLLIDLPSSKPVESNTRTIPIEMEKPSEGRLSGDQTMAQNKNQEANHSDNNSK